MRRARDEDLRLIQEVVVRAQSHQNDLEPFLDLHTEEAVVVNVAGRRVLGRGALREAMAEALGGSLAQILTEVEVVDVRFVTPESALVSCVKHILDRRGPGTPSTSRPLPTTGSLSYLMVLRDGSWRIALAQTTPVQS
jgi:uncharacterized protein (TIGR02246 family)